MGCFIDLIMMESGPERILRIIILTEELWQAYAMVPLFIVL